MNTRIKLLIATSFFMGAVHQPMVAGNLPAAPAASTAATTVIAATPSITPSVGEDGLPVPQPAPSPLHTAQNLDLKNIVSGTLDKNLPVFVIVDKQMHYTHVLQLQNQTVKEVLRVQNSTGKASTPTPEGRTFVTQKQLDPVWKPPVSIDRLQRAVPPWSKTHRNPLGVANIRLGMDRGMIALHGTNEPGQIGKNVSHGCIRHRNPDILKVAAIVQVGTPVYIVSSMDRANVLTSDALPQPALTVAKNSTARPLHKS